MKLWGKTMAELDADHRQMLADRMAREQNATPQQLGQHYGKALPPVRREYHFGTDIPIGTMEEVEMARAVDHGQDDAGHAGKWVVAALLALPIAFALGLLYLASK